MYDRCIKDEACSWAYNLMKEMNIMNIQTLACEQGLYGKVLVYRRPWVGSPLP